MYTPVTSIEALDASKWPLDEKVGAVYNKLEELLHDFETIGLAGLVGKIPEKTIFKRAVRDRDMDQSLDTANFKGSILDQADWCERQSRKALKKNAQEANVSKETVKAFNNLLADSNTLFSDSMAEAFARAEKKDQINFERIVPISFPSEVSIEKLAEINYGRRSHRIPPENQADILKGINESMEVIQTDPNCDAKLLKLAEIIYTMATAPQPLTYTEASAAVTDATAIPPDRGGVRSSGI